ncbi:MAG: hypothetical protein IPK31_21355 [Chitinophagaceae bacterium]|nr:hypothetical protein [Chitinophagaceae bacterium]
MKKIFTLFTALLSFAFSFSQSTYYFRGNGNATQTIGNTFFTASNWREEVAGVISNTAPASLTPGSFLKVVGLQLTITSTTTTTTNFVVMISGGRRPGSTTNLNGELILDDVDFNFNSCSPVSQMILRSNNIGGTLYTGRVTLVDDADIFFRSLRDAAIWAANTAIADNSYVVNAGRLYQATNPIANSGVTPPTHTSGTVSNLSYQGLYDCTDNDAYISVAKARGTGSAFGTNFTFSSAGGTLAASTGTSNFTNTFGTSTGFILNGQATLPLQLGSFSAQKGAGKVSLNWSTVLEVNTSHFEVEQSNNGSSWKTISIVAAKGNSNSAQKYTADDIANYSTKVYYRLKMVDIDGKFEYSPIAVVTFGGKGKLYTC